MGEKRRGTRRRSPELLRLQGDCRGLALIAPLQFVAEPLAFMEIADARALDGGDVNENVLRPVVGLDEAVTFLRVEPFHGSDSHSTPFE